MCLTILWGWLLKGSYWTNLTELFNFYYSWSHKKIIGFLKIQGRDKLINLLKSSDDLWIKIIHLYPEIGWRFLEVHSYIKLYTVHQWNTIQNKLFEFHYQLQTFSFKNRIPCLHMPLAYQYSTKEWMYHWNPSYFSAGGAISFFFFKVTNCWNSEASWLMDSQGFVFPRYFFNSFITKVLITWKPVH